MNFLNLDIKEISVDSLSEEDCLNFIAGKKWETGFVCKKCGHTNYCKGKTPFSRRCTRCKHDESATANTIFHRCHIPLTEAFRIVSMVCNNPSISTYELSRRIEVRQMTCWKLKTRLIDCVHNRGKIDILYTENRSNLAGR